MSDQPKAPSAPDVFVEFGKISVTPVSARRMFLLLTRSHFSDSAHYGLFKEKMAAYVWSRDPKESHLQIEVDYKYDPKKLENRPAIFVGTDDFTYTKNVVDNFVKNNADNSGKGYVTTGATNVIIRHVSLSPDDALALCELSTQFFLGIRPLMQERVGFRKYDVVAQKMSRPFERAEQQADQLFMSDLLINIVFNAEWLSVQESHRIKTISFKQSLVDFNSLPVL